MKWKLTKKLAELKNMISCHQSVKINGSGSTFYCLCEEGSSKLKPKHAQASARRPFLEIELPYVLSRSPSPSIASQRAQETSEIIRRHVLLQCFGHWVSPRASSWEHEKSNGFIFLFNASEPGHRLTKITDVF